MKTKVQKFVPVIYNFLPIIIAGALLLSLLQLQTALTPVQYKGLGTPNTRAQVEAGNIESIVKTEIQDISRIFFGEDVAPKTVENIVESKMDFVSSRKAYPASLSIIQKHEKTIRETARKYGVPEDVAIGVGLLENGGSETAKSPAGALGVFQLMPSTARALGLKVTKSVDERKDPAKNIDAGVRYLALNYYRFGDWGLATWAYHAGEGNVSKAIRLYAKAVDNVDLPGVANPLPIRQYVEKHSITIHKLLSNPSVKTFTKKLKDDSSSYAYKVVATAALFEQAK